MSSWFTGDFLVDGVSANVLQSRACNEEVSQSCPVGKFYPNQTQQISATVYYNNNVRIIVYYNNNVRIIIIP